LCSQKIGNKKIEGSPLGKTINKYPNSTKKPNSNQGQTLLSKKHIAEIVLVALMILGIKLSR
jgi:hypothetical protein